jgi:hypothetical protein
MCREIIILKKKQQQLDLPPRVEGKKVVKPQLAVTMSCQWVLFVTLTFAFGVDINIMIEQGFLYDFF